MKPSPFEYIVPRTVDEAVQARASGGDTVLLAGGQSLIPTLNFRLANPDAVIDLRLVEGIEGVTVDGSWIRVGARTRQRDLELHEGAAAANPLIRETLTNVAHPVIRNRGTVGGSVAHADPAAELPCLLLCLDGEVTAVGTGGSRTIAAADLFEFILSTTLEPDEMLTEVRFPVLAANTGWCFTEFARRHGDFAVAGIAATVTLAADGTITEAKVAACGIATTPVRLSAVEAALAGANPSPEVIAAAAKAAAEAITVAGDEQISSEYREHLVVGLVQKAVTTALGRAGGTTPDGVSKGAN